MTPAWRQKVKTSLVSPCPSSARRFKPRPYLNIILKLSLGLRFLCKSTAHIKNPFAIYAPIVMLGNLGTNPNAYFFGVIPDCQHAFHRVFARGNRLAFKIKVQNILAFPAPIISLFFFIGGEFDYLAPKTWHRREAANH